MTNEEAIKHFEDMKKGIFLYNPNELFDMAIKALEQTMWIPVSERLPKEPGHYLVTMKHGDISFVEQRWYDGEGYNEYVDYFWRNSSNITAWMPLPEPYKIEGSDGEC